MRTLFPIKRLILTPFEKFVNIASSSGFILFFATIVALIWANSPWSDSYEAFKNYPLGFRFGNFELVKPVLLWVNDGLMSIFFFLIGLEVKREILIGELNTLKKASLPIYAALGGVILPVLIFIFLNDNPETTKGWGIPMATDIAFSLAILTVLGKRVPIGLKIFLTALAIVDDILAVMTIAIFYSSKIEWMLLALAMIPYAILVLLLFLKKYSKYVSVILGCIIWMLFLKSGIHPTISGILVAFTLPLSQTFTVRSSIAQLEQTVSKLAKAKASNKPILTKEQIYAIDDIEDWTNKVQSPLQLQENGLHGWVAFFIIPIFALVNAGINFTSNTESIDLSLVTNLAIALIVGKSLGISLFSFLSAKFGLSELPLNIKYQQIIGIGFLAGIGFTMSIFIANLAYADSQKLIEDSKFGILIGSTLSGVIGYLVLRYFGPKKNP